MIHQRISCWPVNTSVNNNMEKTPALSFYCISIFLSYWCCGEIVVTMKKLSTTISTSHEVVLVFIAQPLSPLFSHGLLRKAWIVPPLGVIDLCIYLFILLFVQFVNFSKKCYSSVSYGPILMKLGMIIPEVLGYLKTASLCLYCLYKQSYDCLYFSI